MAHEAPTTGIDSDRMRDEELLIIEGEERARKEVEIITYNARTIGDVRTDIDQLLREVRADGDQEAEVLLKEHDKKVDALTQGYEHVRTEHFGGGKLGENRVGTHDSAITSSLLTIDAIAEEPDQTEEVILHEDGDRSGDVGHAYQKADVEALAVDGQGSAEQSVLEGAELLEGENETGLSQKLRGNVSAARKGQPHELYGTGQKKVAPHYEAIKAYVRGAADRVSTQAEIFRTARTSHERMRELMDAAGYHQEDAERVIQLAA